MSGPLLRRLRLQPTTLSKPNERMAPKDSLSSRPAMVHRHPPFHSAQPPAVPHPSCSLRAPWRHASEREVGRRNESAPVRHAEQIGRAMAQKWGSGARVQPEHSKLQQGDSLAHDERANVLVRKAASADNAGC
eukprot:scaffold10041_cov113-Isochrysis_galbana.AAC.3